MKLWKSGELDTKYLYACAAFFGIAAGYVSSHGVLEGSWTNLILWGLIGMILGIFAHDRKSILVTGAMYGFCLLVSFLFGGYQGSADSIRGFVMLSIVLSLIGILCGIVSVYLGGKYLRPIIRQTWSR
jgi:hypothetical protein